MDICLSSQGKLRKLICFTTDRAGEGGRRCSGTERCPWGIGAHSLVLGPAIRPRKGAGEERRRHGVNRSLRDRPVDRYDGSRLGSFGYARLIREIFSYYTPWSCAGATNRHPLRIAAGAARQVSGRSGSWRPHTVISSGSSTPTDPSRRWSGLKLRRKTFATGSGSRRGVASRIACACRENSIILKVQ
jgi:hypothetical protein